MQDWMDAGQEKAGPIMYGQVETAGPQNARPKSFRKSRNLKNAKYSENQCTILSCEIYIQHSAQVL